MPRLEITPWRNDEELLQVRKQLYPDKYGGDGDQRRKACDRVAMWKLRGRLPHVVESTGALTDAILHDDSQINSTTSIKAVYSTAFCRFVTGIVDMDQTAKFKKSMFAIAKDVGIPATFIDIRHEATHGEMPSLVVFRDVAQKSLTWLFDEYWSKLTDENRGSVTRDMDAEELKGFFRTALRAHLKARIALNTNPTEKVEQTLRTQVTEAYKDIVYGCRNSRDKLTVLSLTLLERKIVVPSKKSMGVEMDSVFDLWDEFLMQLTSHQDKFLSIFVDETCLALVRPTDVDPQVDDYRESLVMWLLHILTHGSWESSREAGCLAVEAVLQVSFTNPAYWTSRLGMILLEDPKYTGLRQRYLGQNEMMKEHLES